MYLLGGVADTNKDGSISFSEFQAFEGLLCQPDALYKTAFQMFDKNGNGNVSFGKHLICLFIDFHFIKFFLILIVTAEFAIVMKKTELYRKVPFKLDGPFVELYFGRERNRSISYVEFSQFLHDFHEECALEAFKLKDPNRTGYITALDFQDIMLNVKNHLLTNSVKDNLLQVCRKLSTSLRNCH